MRIVITTHAEAADALVFANIAKYLLAGDNVAVALAEMPARIEYRDRPDVGCDDVPLALIEPVNSAAIVFGGNAVPPVPGAAQSSAAAAAPEIAPVISSPPVPTVPSPPAALPASAAVVPSVPAAPPSPAAAGTPLLLDTKGLPWDPRIHSKTKAQNKDGTWRQKRETDAAYIATVEAELRQILALPPVASVPPVPAVPPLPQPFQQPPAVPPVAPPAPVIAPSRTFGELMLWLEPHMTVGKITQETLKAAMMGQGVTGGIATLMHKPDLIPAIWDDLAALVAPQ